MAVTRAQSAVQKRRMLSALENQTGKQPQGIRRQSSPRTTRLQRTERDQQHPSPTQKTLPRQDLTTPDKRGNRQSLEPPLAEVISRRPAPNTSDTYQPPNPIETWRREHKWPKEYFEADFEHLLSRVRVEPSLSYERSNSGIATTPSDQKPREEKSVPYENPHYEGLLGINGTFMVKSRLDITSASKDLIKTLLEAKHTPPEGSLFHGDGFEATCENIQNRNEARVINDIAQLIVPSVERLAIFGAKHLDILVESLNEGWNNSIPLTTPRPQPDFSLGFRRNAFSDDQLAILSPFVGDFTAGDQSFFMSTYYTYFPFLTCEIKCSNTSLEVGDRQNAHSMTLAVRGVTELLRAVKRDDEAHRQILGFSISHDHRSVRIYGHYPVIDGKTTKYYRHPIRSFSFTDLDGKERWTAYRVTRNIYDIWMPNHFKMICSAIDQIPANQDFDGPSLPANDSGSHVSSHPDADSASLPVEQDSQSINATQ